jgi:hypothetical protein
MPAVNSELDHVVIVAPTLEQGAQFCERMLGMRLEPGGSHSRMGTHNRVAALGGGIYLEVIAVDPAAKAPAAPRWFGLDQVLAVPRLAGFVARTNNIDLAASALQSVGKVSAMERGNMQWRITIPQDGRIVENGCIPSLIQWPEGIHPTAGMPDSGYRLESLTAYHPQPQWLAAQWAAIGIRLGAKLCLEQAEPGRAGSFMIRVMTPEGQRVVRSEAHDAPGQEPARQTNRGCNARETGPF